MSSSRVILPNFFIVGASKAGTTALYEALSRHPQIYLSPIKEPNYFSHDIDAAKFRKSYRDFLVDYRAFLRTDMTKPAHSAHITDWEDYLALFRKVQSERAIGEASTSYLFSDCAARAIRQTIPDARIIVILRDPVERAYSNYLMDLRTGYARRPFVEELAEDVKDPEQAWGCSRLYVRGGLYSEQIGRYLKWFPRRQLKILLTDDLRQNWGACLTDILGFIDVDPYFALKEIRANEAAAPRSIPLNFVLLHSGVKRMISRGTPERLKGLAKKVYYTKHVQGSPTRPDRSAAIGLFREDVKKLEVLLQRDLSKWMTV